MTGADAARERALAYLRRKGSEAPLDALRAHAAATFTEIEALLDRIPAALRARRPAPGQWSAHEIVDHLVESHRPTAAQLAALVAGRRPQGGAIPPSLQSPQPDARSWEDLLAELRAIHRTLLALVPPVAEDAATTAAVTAPVAMLLKVPGEDGKTARLAWEEELDWKAYLQVFRVHTVEHRAQLERTLEALGAGGAS